MREDRFRVMLWMAFIGATASLIKTGVDALLMLLTASTTPLYLQVTSYITHGHRNIPGSLELLYSLLSDALIGSVLGVTAAYIYRCTPKRYWSLMAIGMGLFLWLGSLTVGNLLKILDSAETTVANLTTHLVSQLLFALFVYVGARYVVPPEGRE